MKNDQYYFVFCYWDGFRERMPYCKKLTPFIPSKNQFLNKTEITGISSCDQPILHKKQVIFAFSKHTNDNMTICIVDNYYIQSHGYTKTRLKTVDDHLIPFEQKESICVYRGTLENGTTYNFKEFENKDGLNQREYLKKIKGQIENFDFSDEPKDIKDQLKYKYILDVDGFSNTWDATVWKLYSGSVLLKPESIWKQWYYDKLQPWVHYVPINNDFSDLNEKIKWCKEHEDECKKIVQNARNFVLDELNWEKVQKDMISIFKNYLQN